MCGDGGGEEIGMWSIEKERVGRAVNLPGPLDR